MPTPWKWKPLEIEKPSRAGTGAALGPITPSSFMTTAEPLTTMISLSRAWASLVMWARCIVAT